MRAEQILELLAVKHSKDVFVPECKDGPSQFTSHKRVDAWAMSRSWANPLVSCYEIKVSRSDFIADGKWRGYLDLCNVFYFVAPPGVIDATELPADTGLIVTSKNGTRLYTKKKAPYRDIVIDENVFRYVLMCRAQITRDFWNTFDNLQHWREWLAEKREKQDVGHRVSRRLQELVGERIVAVECENRRLKSENEELAKIKEVCEALGLSQHGLWNIKRSVEEALERIKGGNIERELKSAEKALAQVRETIGGTHEQST